MNTRPTPETDAFAIKFINGVMSGRYWVPVDVARKLESELNEARGQRDRLAEALQKIRSLCRQEVPDIDCYCRDCEMLNTIDDALQSLTTNEPISK
jgi:hypothetical protein